MLMRDIDWWCLIEQVCMFEGYVMLMRDIDWWCLIEPDVNERNRLVVSY